MNMFDDVSIRHEFGLIFDRLNDMIDKRNRTVELCGSDELYLEKVSCAYKISDPKFTAIGMTFRNLREKECPYCCISTAVLSIITENSCENMSQRKHPARIDLEVNYGKNGVLKLSHTVDDIAEWNFVDLDDHASIDIIHTYSVNPNWKNEVIQLICPVFGEDGDITYSSRLTAFISDAWFYFQK